MFKPAAKHPLLQARAAFVHSTQVAQASRKLVGVGEVTLSAGGRWRSLSIPRKGHPPRTVLAYWPLSDPQRVLMLK